MGQPLRFNVCENCGGPSGGRPQCSTCSNNEQERRLTAECPTSTVQLRADLSPMLLDDIGEIVSRMTERCLTGNVDPGVCRYVAAQFRELANRVRPVDDIFAGGVEGCADAIELFHTVPTTTARRA